MAKIRIFLHADCQKIETDTPKVSSQEKMNQMTLCGCLSNGKSFCSHERITGEIHTFILEKIEFANDEVRQIVRQGDQIIYEANYIVCEDKSLRKIEELIYESGILVQKNTFFPNGKPQSGERYLNGQVHGSRFEIRDGVTIQQKYSYGVIQTETRSRNGQIEDESFYINGDAVCYEDYQQYQLLLKLPLPVGLEIYQNLEL